MGVTGTVWQGSGRQSTSLDAWLDGRVDTGPAAGAAAIRARPVADLGSVGDTVEVSRWIGGAVALRLVLLDERGRASGDVTLTPAGESWSILTVHVRAGRGPGASARAARLASRWQGALVAAIAPRRGEAPVPPRPVLRAAGPERRSA